MSAPNFTKTKRGANGKFLPKPLLFHLRHPNSKTNEPKFWQILSPKNSFAKISSTELALEFRQFLLWRNPTSPATTIPKKETWIGDKQKRMRGGEARAERNSRSGGRLSYPTVWWSGCCAVTEFVVERTITFHITTHAGRAKSLPHFVLKIGSDLVQ